MSLKKRLVDRVEAVDVVLRRQVEPTHTETLMFRAHPAVTKSRNERKRERRARKKER
jgi:hypothetical protein